MMGRRANSPSPRRGEGWGEGAPRILKGRTPSSSAAARLLLLPAGEKERGATPGVEQFLADGLDHAFSVFQHIIVPEADDSVAEAFDGFRPVSIDLLAMLPAVEFDDQVRVPAGEVGDVRTDRELTDELCAFELARAEVTPQALFGVRGISPKFSCVRRQAFFRQCRSPSPQPSPRWGEGVLADRPLNA